MPRASIFAAAIVLNLMFNLAAIAYGPVGHEIVGAIADERPSACEPDTASSTRDLGAEQSARRTLCGDELDQPVGAVAAEAAGAIALVRLVHQAPQLDRRMRLVGQDAEQLGEAPHTLVFAHGVLGGPPHGVAALGTDVGRGVGQAVVALQKLRARHLLR